MTIGPEPKSQRRPSATENQEMAQATREALVILGQPAIGVPECLEPYWVTVPLPGWNAPTIRRIACAYQTIRSAIAVCLEEVHLYEPGDIEELHDFVAKLKRALIDAESQK